MGDKGNVEEGDDDINGGYVHFDSASTSSHHSIDFDVRGAHDQANPSGNSLSVVLDENATTASELRSRGSPTHQDNEDSGGKFHNTPNFRSTSTFLRHPYYQINHIGHHQPHQSLDMNAHTQSELLPANNNSRQQLNSSTLSYTTPTTSPYNDLHLVANEMNALYENTRPFDQVRDFHQAQLQEQHDHIQEHNRYPSPPPPISNDPYAQQQQQQPQQQLQQHAVTPESRGEGQVEPKSESEAPSPGRSKPIIKPERQVIKTASGHFQCDWPNCTEEVKTFARKCEWS